MKLIKFLAFYTLIYIVVSFVFHLQAMMQVGHYSYNEILWLLIKVPVMAFCILTLARSERK